MTEFKLNDLKVKLTAICAAGIVINIAGANVARILELPVYLDTIGTVFIAVLGGYMPGITVGFMTNFLGSGLNLEEMYFGLVNIIVAMISAFFAGRGYFDSLPKVLLIIPLLALVTSFFGAFIEELVSPNASFDSLGNLREHFLSNFVVELPDKGLSVVSSFLLYKIFPDDLKEFFPRIGKMQAPLSPEMKDALRKANTFVLPRRVKVFLYKICPDRLRKRLPKIVKMKAPPPSEVNVDLSNENSFVLSLRTKMVFNLLSVTVVVALFISFVSYNIYQQTATREHIRIADGITTMVVNEINPNRVDDYLEFGRSAPDYEEVERALYRIRASNSDIKYIYVYKIMEDGCHVVFDLETTEVEASQPGDIEEFDEEFGKYMDDLLAGRPIPPIPSDGKYGLLLSIYKPVYNHQGQCVCYAAIDFSIEDLSNYGKMFITRVIALFSGMLIFILALALTFIENNIILPVNTMACCARNFAYDSEAAREQNIERIKSLEIKTHDEIENLYAAFLKTTSDSMHYFENLKRSKIQLAVMDELAHKDALTGLKNKAAYNEYTAKLDADIFEGKASFAIIMIDVNYLKRVNDTYGHERGNEYLINAAKLACTIFGEELVYRIGGDEFVVILDGDNLARCEKTVADIRAVIEKLRADTTLEPWEKVSAAIGIAHYTSGDQTADEVFKRADADMYRNKLAMKAVRRD